MKPGDILELAIWLAGTETEADLANWKSGCDGIARKCEKEHGVIIAPMEFVVKDVMDDRVPPVPDHISGPDVRLLVGEAIVKAWALTPREDPGFVADIEKDDLERLRAMTRKAHRKAKPRDPALTDRQCDQIINSLGPDAAVKTLRGTADGRSLH